MSTRNYIVSIGAGETQPLPGGRFFLVKAAASAITLTTRGTPSAPASFQNIGAGLSYGPVADNKAWSYLDLFSAAAQTVEIIVSDEAEVKVGSVVSVSGSVVTIPSPSAAIVGALGTIAAVTSVDLAANPARRAITITNKQGGAGALLYVRDTGGITSAGIELSPGQAVTLTTTAAIRLRNNDATLSLDYSTLEET